MYKQKIIAVISACLLFASSAQALDNTKKALNDTFLPPKILLQQLSGTNPSLTPLIEKGHDVTFAACFYLKHAGKEGNFVNTVSLKTDCACYALQAQKAELKLLGQLSKSQPENTQMVFEGAVQAVGCLLVMSILSKHLPRGYGLRLLTHPPLVYATAFGACKAYNGAQYREYLQRRLENNNELKNMLAKAVVK